MDASPSPSETDPTGRERAKRAVGAHYDRWAASRAAFRRKNRYYYDQLVRTLRYFIPEGSRVLELGCADGYLLRALKPSVGLGIDVSREMVELGRRVLGKASPIELRLGDAETEVIEETYDYILLSDLLGNLTDIQACLENLRRACHRGTRVILNYHGIMWEPLLKLGEKMGAKMPTPPHNWLASSDIEHFCRLTGFEILHREKRWLLPMRIPLLSAVCNGFLALLPGVRRLCLSNFITLRKIEFPPSGECSVSVLIPSRNERGNIAACFERTPVFGKSQELVFVDGHSTDGTPEEIRRQMTRHPQKKVRLLEQPGRGKGDAVRYGFEHCAGEVLMILDADLSVAPEDLPKFYRALVEGRGEFVHGSRLVYPLEQDAMRFLNILGNVFFSMVFSWLLGQRFKDTLCGTKVFYRHDYERMREQRAYFGGLDPFGDFDLLFAAAKLQMKILEVPIRYQSRRYGETNIARFRNGWQLMKMVAYAVRKIKL